MNELRQLKADNGFSNKDLAIILGVSEKYVSLALYKPLSKQMVASVALIAENIRLKEENAKLKEAIKTIKEI